MFTLSHFSTLCVHRRALYKLQRQLLVVDLWPLVELSERADEKAKLLLAVHRLSRRGLLTPPPPAEPGADPNSNAAPVVDRTRKARLSTIAKLKRLTVEEFQEEVRQEAAPSPRPNRQQTSKPREGERSRQRSTDYFPSRYGYSPEQRTWLDQRLMREEAYDVRHDRRYRRDRRAEGEGAAEEQGAARAARARYWRDRDAHNGAR